MLQYFDLQSKGPSRVRFLLMQKVKKLRAQLKAAMNYNQSTAQVSVYAQANTINLVVKAKRETPILKLTEVSHRM